MNLQQERRKQKNYRKVYAQTLFGKTKILSAGEKSVVVSLLVAQAHHLTMQALEHNTFEKFVQSRYIHSQHTQLSKPFTMASFYKDAKNNDTIEAI